MHFNSTINNELLFILMRFDRFFSSAYIFNMPTIQYCIQCFAFVNVSESTNLKANEKKIFWKQNFIHLNEQKKISITFCFNSIEVLAFNHSWQFDAISGDDDDDQVSNLFILKHSYLSVRRSWNIRAMTCLRPTFSFVCEWRRFLKIKQKKCDSFKKSII